MKRALIGCFAAAVLLLAQRQRGKRGEVETFHTETPARRFDLLLTRPQAGSVTVSVLAHEDLEGWFEYAGKRGPETKFAKDVPVPAVLGGLAPNRRFSYRFRHRKPGERDFETTPEYSFHTQRAPGSAFTFAVQADSHLDENSEPATYERTLANMRATGPDFLIDLGDTFMTDKRRDDFRAAAAQYPAQRYYFGLIAHSAPLFLVLGNHDGEGGARPDMAAWSLAHRTRYFPNPRPGGIYSGNDANPERENYYAWEWGDALFVALDPFWATTSRARGDNWRWTLGEAQYRWLGRTLETSRARWKFVFIHHPVGGKGEPIRGGIEAARYNEWGGRNADGSDGFRERRPGWAMPVHALLVKHNVSAVFHGHDHLLAREQLDGVIYQLVPQPGNPRAGGAPRNAVEYGYTHGPVLSASGFVKVRVGEGEPRIEFMKTAPR